MADDFSILRKTFGNEPNDAEVAEAAFKGKVVAFLREHRPVINNYISELSAAMSNPKKDRKQLDYRVEVLREMVSQLTNDPQAFFSSGRDENLASALADATQPNPLFYSNDYASRLRTTKKEFADLVHDQTRTR